MYNPKTTKTLIRRLEKLLCKIEQLSDDQFRFERYNVIDSRSLYQLMEYVTALKIESKVSYAIVSEMIIHQSTMQTIAMSKLIMVDLNVKTLVYILSWFTHFGWIDETANRLLDFYTNTLKILPFVTKRKDIMHMMYALTLMHRYDIDVWTSLISNLSQVWSDYSLDNEEFYKFHVIFTIMKQEHSDLYERLIHIETQIESDNDLDASNEIKELMHKMEWWISNIGSESNKSAIHFDVIRTIENLVDRKYSHNDIWVSSEHMKNGLIYNFMISFKPTSDKK